jgi:ParB-like chromosome segregation protein Spo0J
VKILDFFLKQTADAGQNLDRLADVELQLEERAEAIDKVSRAFDRMAADGLIDKKEMAELKQLMLKQGLDTRAIEALYAKLSEKDASVSAKKGSDFQDLVTHVLNDAKLDAKQSAGDEQFLVQLAVGNYTTSQSSASSAMQAEHAAYMTVIKNLVA